MGYRNLERIHVFLCILGRKIRDSENKNGMHGCVQLDACNWWDGGIKGTCRGDMRLLCWKATPKRQ